ncbi:MAG: hypothetical protein DA408_00135 [Bacteroidetes bacterium]|nr:MAG: hypothetical protein C7N36_03375 [Bacteroidota bacterium]PTM15065.1 MAG: hypothetical protein DA408_00135 [Bacteroidota bacterium]
MRKIFFIALLFLVSASTGWGQLNMSLASHLQYNVDLNDIWGYVAPDGTEYALVGANNGVSIVSLADPANATEVAFVPGQNSIWRDLKTWGEFAYVVTDQGGTTEGLTVIDLSNLPASVDFFHWTPNLPDLGTLQNCHNIFIDEFGYAYLAGCNLNSGGMLFIDVFTTPGQPSFAGAAPNRYAHDVYVRDNKMYSSELTRGRMAIYDVSDKANVVLEGVQTTPYEFTHNIWLSDNSQVAFTTDEQPNAPVAAYDVSDPADIIELDQFRPTTTLNEGVIPHNVHVWNDWLIISYYTDGGIVVDASRPDNLIEVGNFDTFFGAGAGFNGVWGAYPFLPSGVVLLTDIGNGLYVLDVNYVRGCYLEGDVSDAVSGAALNGVEIAIEAVEENLSFSRIDGTYGTGIATAGTYQVRFSKPGYNSLTTTVTIANGELTILNVQLQPLATFSKTGSVVVAGVGAGIGGSTVVLDNGISVFTFLADEAGVFQINNVYEGAYDVYVGAWGYQERLIENLAINNNDDVVFALTSGYQDGFALDLGWTTSASSVTRTGFWERGVPLATYQGTALVNPGFDVEGDLGNACYVTGNAGGGAANDDVDGGSVTLTSPPMALASLYVDPVLEYNLWFWNGGGDGNPNDELVVTVSNGITSVTVETVNQTGSFWRQRSQLQLGSLLEITDNMQVSFTTSDFDPNGHLLEAAVDAFAVTGEQVVGTRTASLEVEWQNTPNPFRAGFRTQYQLPVWQNSGQLQVFNVLGQLVENYPLTSAQGFFDLGANWPAGVYLLHLEVPGQGTAVERVVKQ